MTKRLYYDNSYLFEFESKVKDVKKPDLFFDIILSETAFYPESGGQLHDTGLLDSRRVLKVYLNDNHDVVHRCESWTAKVGQKVVGSIDRDRRLGNMRKHTGQHILSQAFLRILSAETVGAHLGETESTIELVLENLTDDNIKDVERLANNIIVQNLPVKISYHEYEKLGDYNVRRIPDREGVFRVVSIGDFEHTACGGTHCAFTGEVGLVKIITQEKIRGNTRVTFFCGEHAIDDYHDKNKTVNNLMTRLTCHFTNLDISIEKLLAQNESMRREISRLNRELMPHRSKELEESAEQISGIKIICETFKEQDIKYLRDLALYITKSFNAITLFDVEDKLIISVSDGIKYNAAMLAELFIENYEGRGGGNPVIAQVGGLSEENRKSTMDRFMQLIRDKISG